MPETRRERTQRIKLTGLWKFSFRRDNKDYTGLSGNLTGSTRFTVMPNTFKKPDSNEPDYNLFLDEVKSVEVKEDEAAPGKL